MWKAMRCCAVWALAGAAVSAVAATTLSSRYGTLSTKEVDFEQRVYFNGKPVPLATALYDLNISLNKKFQIGDKDVFLITSSGGGTGCPVLYRFITVSATGAVSSQEFGTCSDLITARQKGATITVRMPKFNAGKRVYQTYIYKNGKVSGE